MSKYNHYAQDLNAAFIEARTQFAEAYTKMQTLQAAYNDMLHYKQPETFTGENEWHIQRAKADYMTAKADFEETNARAWARLESYQKELTAALRAEVEADCLADPAAVDAAALDLMQTGVLSAADYKAFAERYAENGTMRRLVAHYAQQKADGSQDVHERSTLTRVVHSCQDSTLQDWDTLCGIMSYCSGGHSGQRRSPEHISGMSAKWEDLTHDNVEAF